MCAQRLIPSAAKFFPLHVTIAPAVSSSGHIPPLTMEATIYITRNPDKLGHAARLMDRSAAL